MEAPKVAGAKNNYTLARADVRRSASGDAGIVGGVLSGRQAGMQAEASKLSTAHQWIQLSSPKLSAGFEDAQPACFATIASSRYYYRLSLGNGHLVVLAMMVHDSKWHPTPRGSSTRPQCPRRRAHSCCVPCSTTSLYRPTAETRISRSTASTI
jgi:hypothetical protein